jgi:hypothetical protein
MVNDEQTFLVENRLSLASVARLLPVVAALSLSGQRGFSRLVLGDFMLGVLLARLALAVCLAGLGNVDL